MMERPSPRRRERRRIGPSAALSALLHFGLLLAIVLLARRRVEAPQWLPPPSVQMVFQGGGKGPTSVPNKAPRFAHRRASPPPVPAAPAAPAPPATAPAPFAPPPSPAPSARPVAPLPPAPTPAPTPVPIGPPAQPQARVPPTPSPPAPLLSAPSLRAVPAPTVPASRPAPAISLPLPPARPVPPPPPTRPAAPTLRFPAPMPFSLGAARPSVTSANPARDRPPSRGVDLSFAAHGAGADRLSINGLLDRDGVGPDWSNAFRAWLDRHTYYPHDAGEFGEYGDVVVDFVVSKDGHVSDLRLVSSSGHPLLDTATLGMFRDATLPPLPPQDGARQTVHFTMRYVIIPP